MLAASQWPGAYYLAGYSLECALKSCILAYIDRTGIIFENKEYAKKCWTHDLKTLVEQADLKVELNKATGANPELAKNWALAKDWSESSRYVMHSESQAKDLFNAITDNTDGVLPWVKKFW